MQNKKTLVHRTTIINVKTVARTGKAGAPFQRGTTYENIVYLYRFILPMMYKNIAYSLGSYTSRIVVPSFTYIRIS